MTFARLKKTIREEASCSPCPRPDQGVVPEVGVSTPFAARPCVVAKSVGLCAPAATLWGFLPRTCRIFSLQPSTAFFLLSSYILQYTLYILYIKSHKATISCRPHYSRTESPDTLRCIDLAVIVVPRHQRRGGVAVQKPASGKNSTEVIVSTLSRDQRWACRDDRRGSNGKSFNNLHSSCETKHQRDKREESPHLSNKGNELGGRGGRSNKSESWRGQKVGRVCRRVALSAAWRF